MHSFLFAVLILVGAWAQVGTPDADEQHLLRRIRFGNRELHLPLQLQNDQLVVTNDKLDVTLAKLRDQEPDNDRVLIDQFLADQTKAAIKDAMVFARMYQVSNAPPEDLVELDGELDDADEKCHSDDSDGHPAVYRNLAEAQAACSDLQEISSAVAAHRIATPQGWVSVFKQDRSPRNRTGYKLFLLDTEKLRRDEASRADLRLKKLLIITDHSLLVDDKQIWLTEMSEQETLEFNIKHPEHQMGDLDSTLTMLKKFRDDMASLNARYRGKLRRTS